MEIDHFCDAMISIREEIHRIERGEMPRDDNLLKNAPHTAADLADSEWKHPYSRKEACFPKAGIAAHKYWPPVNRVDNAHGDRNLICSCPPLDQYENVDP